MSSTYLMIVTNSWYVDNFAHLFKSLMIYLMVGKKIAKFAEES